MADSFIQVAPDSTGKQLQTYLNTISAQPVHAEAVVLVDSTGTPITILPVSGTFFQAIQPVSGTVTATGPMTNTELRASPVSVSGTFFQATQPVSGTVNSTQSGTWNVATVTTITNPVTVAAGTNLNTALLATQAGTTDGTHKTQIVDGSGNVIGSNANALNVYLASVTANSGTNLNTGNITVTRFTGGSLMANGQVAATNVAATLVAARALRRSVTIRNLDATNSGYVGLATIATTNGMLIQALESMSVDFTGLIQVITATGTTANFAYLETYDA